MLQWAKMAGEFFPIVKADCWGNCKCYRFIMLNIICIVYVLPVKDVSLVLEAAWSPPLVEPPQLNKCSVEFIEQSVWTPPWLFIHVYMWTVSLGVSTSLKHFNFKRFEETFWYFSLSCWITQLDKHQNMIVDSLATHDPKGTGPERDRWHFFCRI